MEPPPPGTHLPAHSHTQPARAPHSPLHQGVQVLPETLVKDCRGVLSEMTRETEGKEMGTAGCEYLTTDTKDCSGDLRILCLLCCNR